MSKAPRPTRYIRAKIEFTIVLEEPIDSNTIIGPRDLARLDLALLSVLSGHPLVMAIAGGTRVSSSLDARPRNSKHMLATTAPAPKRRSARPR